MSVEDIYNIKEYANEFGRYKTKKELGFILRNIDKKQALNILDIGGGRGRIAMPLLKNGHDIYIVDINKEAIDKLPNIKNLRKNCVDFMKFRTSEHFDLSLMIESLYYMPDIKKVFQLVNKILKLNGVLIFTCVNKSSFRYNIRKLKDKNISNYNDLYLHEYYSCIIESGFLVESVEGFCWQPFRTDSNNKFVKLFAYTEEKFRLYKWIKQSPWILFKVRKIKET